MTDFKPRKSDDIKFAERGSDTWYLYHSIKNENALIPVIVFSFLTLFFKGGGWIISICIWIWYFSYCYKNNEALNRDPRILKEREQAKQAYIKAIEYLKRVEESEKEQKG